MDDGTVHRITTPRQPAADRGIRRPRGPLPLTVSFGSTGSSTRRAALSYTWDLNGDGTYGDATGPTASHLHRQACHPSLRVTDGQGATATASVTDTVATPRRARSSTRPRRPDLEVGDTINTPATPPRARTHPNVGAELVADPASLLHADRLPHPTSPTAGVSSGSFTAPDHGYPCWLEVRLTATTQAGWPRPRASAGPENGRTHVRDQPGRSGPQRPGGERRRAPRRS